MRLRNTFVTVVVASSCAFILAGCAIPFTHTSSTSPTTPSPVSPTTSQTPSELPSPSPSLQTSTYAMYYFAETQQGLRLYREWHTVTEAKPADAGLASLQRLVNSGDGPFDSDYKTAWGTGSTINSIKHVGPLAIVDITLGKLNVGAEAEQRAVDQLVWTLTANDKSVRSVKFTSDGKTLQSFAGHVDATATFKREAASDVLASVWISVPGQSDSATPWIVSNPVQVSGTACVFEAAVPWELIKDGKVVQSDMTMASGSCPVQSPWKVDLGSLSPGTYVFKAKDLSAEDGSVVSQDTKTFVVK